MSSSAERVFPPGSWDTHHHIFDLDLFPLAPTRHFTPASAPLAALEQFHASLGIDHPGLAHGLSFGSDISSLEYYLEYFKEKAAAYGVISLDTVTDEELVRLNNKGLRGIRIDFHLHKCQHDLELQKKWMAAYAARVSVVNWGVQVYSPHPEFWDQLAPIVRTLSTPIVLDHFGGLRTASFHRYLTNDPTATFDVLNQPGLAAIKALLASGHLYLKLSAPYRVTEDPTNDDLELLVKDLVAANPARILYGSDWPHTQPFHRRPKDLDAEATEHFVNFDDRAWVVKLKSWLSEDEWRAMMVKNPRRLFEYEGED